MKIVRLGFANFRSIGSEPIMLDLQRRINLLIGANNSGKSNVLEILRRLKTERLEQIKIAEVDLHKRDGSRLVELVVDVEATKQNEVPEGVRRFHVAVSGGTVSRWLTTPFDGLDHRQFAPFMSKWLQRTFTSVPRENDLKQYQQQAAAEAYRTLRNLVPELHVIPQFRQIRSGAYSIDGTGIVELLAEWKAPEIGKDSDRERFQKVQEFLRELLGEDQIELDVSRANPELIVERGTLRTSIEKLRYGRA
jgi:AAA ATPase domain